MRKKPLARMAALVAGGLTLALLTSCAAALHAPSADTPGASLETVDSTGRALTISLPIERVAILDTGTAAVMRGLDVLDLLVGNHSALADSPLWPELRDVPIVATYAETSFEALAEADPDLVFSSVHAHGVVTDNQLLNGFQIVDFKISLRQPHLMKQEVLTLGSIFGKEAAAQEIVAFYSRIEDEIARKIADVPVTERPTVFVEYHAGDFNTGGPNSRFYEQVLLAGGQNIAASIDGEKQVSAEWVAEQNPDFVIREGAALGYGVGSTDEAELLHAELIGRPGLSSTKAVHDGNVFVLPIDAYSRPGYVIGVAHMAHWMYPDRFDDDFVESVVEEFTRLFRFPSDLGGIWGYPSSATTR